MRTIRNAVAAAVLLSVLPMAHGQEAVTGDLDGDGRPENISLGYDDANNEFVLTVGDLSARGEGCCDPGVAVVDLDSSDGQKEIAVFIGENDYEQRVWLYAFDGEELSELGTVPDLTRASGNGIILADSWQLFWMRRDKYVLDREAGKITEVPQDAYYVGVEVKVRQSFPIMRSRTDWTPVAKLAPGSRIQLLVAAPMEDGFGGYLYLVKSWTGLVGWASGTDLREYADLPLAG